MKGAQVMDADWYEDPLGRYDGRFFDGEAWTEQVSDSGALVLDPDFPPASFAAEPEPPAVAEISSLRQKKASMVAESPARTVAVLDGPTSANRDGDHDSSRRLSTVVLLAALVVALAVGAFVVLNRSDGGQPAAGTATPVDLDDEQEDRVEDLEQGGLIGQDDTSASLDVDSPAGVVDPEATFDASEMIEVGALRVVNGESLLADLEDWHEDFAGERGAQSDATIGCWFGQLGGAAVQVAHCGPVGGSVDTEYLFDTVPLVFEDVEGGEVALPIVDAVMTDARLANAVVLVGSPDNPPPAPLGEIRASD